MNPQVEIKIAQRPRSEDSRGFDFYVHGRLGQPSGSDKTISWEDTFKHIIHQSCKSIKSCWFSEAFYIGDPDGQPYNISRASTMSFHDTFYFIQGNFCLGDDVFPCCRCVKACAAREVQSVAGSDSADSERGTG